MHAMTRDPHRWHAVEPSWPGAALALRRAMTSKQRVVMAVAGVVSWLLVIVGAGVGGRLVAP